MSASTVKQPNAADLLKDSMSPQEIVRTEFAKHDYGMDWKQMYATLVELVKKPEYRVLQSNNSLLLAKNIKTGNVLAFLLSADPPEDMPNNLNEFFTALKKLNVKRVVIQTPDHQVAKFVGLTKFKFTKTSAIRNNFGPNVSAINITVEL
jgi:hypothetical protein